MEFSIKFRKIFAFLFSLIILVLTILFLYLFAEKYFFDKLFYFKSVRHGYWVYSELSKKWTILEDFGMRSVYFRNLNGWLNQEEQDNLKLKDNDDVFRIVVFGDSYVWGQGVVWKKTLTQVLERKLQKKYSVEVISLANCGDFIGDYWSDWQKASKVYEPDFYIFSITYNDMTPTINSYQEAENQILIQFCEEKFPDAETLVEKRNDVNGIEDVNNQDQDVFHLNNPINNCLVKKSISDLPRENALYLLTDGYLNWTEERIAFFKESLLQNGKKVVDSREKLETEGFRKYKNQLIKNGLSAFEVSSKETHPSKLAHQFYADILYNELIKVIPDEYRK